MPFKNAFDKTMGHEGGYVHDPVDRGGETYKGITRKWWSTWPGWRIIDSLKPIRDTKALNNNQELDILVRKFYESEFWLKPRLNLIDDISVVMAEKLFDTGINVDMTRACRWFQSTLNLLNRNQKSYKDILVDGRIGPVTATTFKQCLDNNPLQRIIVVFAIHQGEHYKSIMERDPSQERFVGWFDRLYYI